MGPVHLLVHRQRYAGLVTLRGRGDEAGHGGRGVRVLGQRGLGEERLTDGPRPGVRVPGPHRVGLAGVHQRDHLALPLLHVHIPIQ